MQERVAGGHVLDAPSWLPISQSIETSAHLEARKLFLESLERIAGISSAIGRRWGFSHERGEDFASWVKLRLIERDYAVLRLYRGESRLSTYLTCVIRNLARDYRARQLGRFRPSRPAQARGTAAIELERLVYLEGHTHDEAISILKQNHGIKKSREELGEILGRLPPRFRPRRVSSDVLENLTADAPAEERIRRRELACLRDRLRRCLTQARSELSKKDREILRLRFDEGLTAPQIAARIGTEQRSVYTRCHRLLQGLRQCLEQEGLHWRELSHLVGWDGTARRRQPGGHKGIHRAQNAPTDCEAMAP